MMALHWILLSALGGITLVDSSSVDIEDLEEVSILTLSTIDYEPGKDLPEDIKALDGKRIVLTGWVDIKTPEGVTEFRLVADTCGCDGTKLQHFVDVTLENGTMGYRANEIKVVGTLSVGEAEEDGYVTSLFRFTAEKVME